jgi:hypothetical protein
LRRNTRRITCEPREESELDIASRLAVPREVPLATMYDASATDLLAEAIVAHM